MQPIANPNYKVRDKWYSSYLFPLVPMLTIRKSDESNESNFSFHWLIFKVWSRSALGLEVAFVCDTHWGIGFTFCLPYLRVIACIPCPQSVGTWSQKNLWRKPKSK